MARIDMKINGRRITSSHQLQRELKKSCEKQLENGIRKAAGPGVQLKKTRDGFQAIGTPQQIERMKRRLR